MVCADDTMTNLLDGWVDVSVVLPEVQMIPPSVEAELTKSPTIDSPHVVVDGEMRMDDTTISLAVRQRRQREAQIAFLRDKGIIKNEYDVKEDYADYPEDFCQAKELVVPREAKELALPEEEPKQEDAYTVAVNAARKASVAAAGGALVAVGAILTPLPTPGGILLAGAGLGVLSTEFECAKRALDTGKEKLVHLIDSIPEEENIQDDTEKESSLTESKDGDDDASALSGNPKMAPTKSSSTASNKGEVRASIEDHARRIGKSIRPFLTDEDAPRRAMEEMNAKSQRAYVTVCGKLSDFVAYATATPDLEPETVTAVTMSSFAGNFRGIVAGLSSEALVTATLNATQVPAEPKAAEEDDVVRETEIPVEVKATEQEKSNSIEGKSTADNDALHEESAANQLP